MKIYGVDASLLKLRRAKCGKYYECINYAGILRCVGVINIALIYYKDNYSVMLGGLFYCMIFSTNWYLNKNV